MVSSPAPAIRDVLSSRKTPDGQDRYGFFNSNLKNARKEWGKLVFLTFGLITIFMFLFLSIYFGSYYDQISRAALFNVQIIDLDSIASPNSATHSAILGPALQNVLQEAKNQAPHLGWYETSDATLQNFRIESGGQGLDPFEYAKERVHSQDVWAVIIVNANATSGVWDAILNGANWDPSGAMTFVWTESRNFYGSEQYVQRLNLQLMRNATLEADTTLANQVLSRGDAATLLSNAPPGSIMGAFGYSSYDTAPFNQLAGIASTTVGTVYLIIFTFLISITWNNQALPLIADKLTLWSEVLVKLVVPFIGYFWLSLNYSLVSLAFQVTFSGKYGPGGFVIYWMANWVTMSALGFVMETVYLWLGPFFPFFLVFWTIFNVSVAFLDITDMQTFYRYGFAFPIWNLVDASKSIIFGTKNHLLQDFAVELGWMVVWAILLSITVIYQRRKKETERMKKVWEEMKEKDTRRDADSEESEDRGGA